MKKCNLIISKFLEELRLEKKEIQKIDDEKKKQTYLFLNSQFYLIVKQLKKCKFLTKSLKKLDLWYYVDNDNFHDLKIVTKRKGYMFFIGIDGDENFNIYLMIAKLNRKTGLYEEKVTQINISDLRKKYN